MGTEKNPLFFPTPGDFRNWLRKNHEKSSELWVGFYKKASGKPSITWPESVDQALCFGWIDGIRKSIDEISYKIRFTPRKPDSHWSDVNLKKVRELKKNDLMHPSGLRAFNKRNKKRSRGASYEQKKVALGKEYEKEFRSNKKAWKYFSSQAPSYQKTTIWWVLSAKREETRRKRFKTLISSSENEEFIPPMKWTQKKGSGK